MNKVAIIMGSESDRAVVDPNNHDIDTFTKLVSLPDAIVYLQRPEEMLVGRTKARKHNPISGTETKNVVEFIKNASITFNTIFRSPRLRTQLLVVNASECKIAEVNSQKINRTS